MIEPDLWAQAAVKPNNFLDVPLKQMNTGTQLEYVSALAFKLSQFQPLSTLALADQIQASLNHQTQRVKIDTPPERIWRNFIITIVEPGWIYLRLSDSGLAEWLQWTIDLPWQTCLSWQTRQLVEDTALPWVGASSVRHSDTAFEILHTYARCNSVLHLGRDAKLIQFEAEQDLSDLSQPIPWLNAEQTFEAQHLQDWALIRQLSEAIDYLADSASPSKPASPQATRQALKMADQLSQTFQRFHAACRIGGMAEQERPLAQVRLGLVWLTRKVLQVLIEARLQWVATSEL